MQKLDKDKLALLKEYFNYLNQANDLISEVAYTAQSKINPMSQYRHIFAILFGVELIKADLIRLIILHDYVEELKKVESSNGTESINKMRDYLSWPYGNAVKEFCDKYNISFSNPGLSSDLWLLNKKRNDTIHHAIFTYRGDIDKADREIKTYVLSQPINTLLPQLSAVFKHKREENEKLNNLIKEKGLL